MDKQPRKSDPARRDIFIAATLVVCVFALAAIFDLHEMWMAWAGVHEYIELDEAPLALSLAVLGFAWYTARRSGELRRELQRRANTAAQLADQVAARGRAEKALGDLDARLRGIMDNVVDGIVTMDERGMVESFNAAAEGIFGYAADEIIGRNVKLLMPEPDRSLHDGYLEAFRDTGKGKILGIGPREVIARRKDGSTFPMDLATSEMRLGGRRVFIGAVRDVTHRRQAREALQRKSDHVRLLQEVAVAANEARDLRWPLQTSLDAICRYTRWPVGHVYMLDDEGRGILVSTKIWHMDDAERFEAFREITEKTSFEPGVGLPGRVMTSGQPAWVEDVNKDPDFPRARGIRDIGVKSGFAFPILAGKLVVGVMECFSDEVTRPDEEFLEVMRHIGTQLGRAAERSLSQKELRQSRETLRTVIDAVPAVINAKDTDGRYIFMNAYQAGLIGTRPRDVIGKTPEEVCDETYAARVRAADETVIASGEGIPDFEYTGKSADGVVRSWLSTKAPAFDDKGAVKAVVTVSLDISARKRAEESLRMAMEAAQAANRAKSEFLATMSHELRTPLNAIIGFSEIMKGEMLGPMENRQYATYAGDIHESGTQLLSLINDILDISRAEVGKLELAEGDVDTRTVLDIALMLMKARAEDRDIGLETDIPADLEHLRGDERLIKHTVVHLLSNAIKFTPAGGTVRVSAERRGDGGLAITVRDTGIGIAADDMDRVLTPFSQADSTLERLYEGSGLGLPLAKTVMELHGGTLSLKSTVGVGTTVTVVFPAGRVATDRSLAV